MSVSTLAELNINEATELQRNEAIIQRGLHTFVEVGTALLAIRDLRLYREGHDTFEKYCQVRWRMVASRARQLISAAEVAADLQSVTNVTLANEAQARPLMGLNTEQRREAWTLAVETAPESGMTAAHVERVVDQMTGEVLAPAPDSMAVHYSSDSAEWYTPPAIIAKVVELFGAIDLDPCSNDKNTPRVPARQHYTKDDNGLLQHWTGRVYMNPPYGREIVDWIEALCEQYESGDVLQGIALVPARTDTEWFNRLRDYPRCFVKGRLSFSDNSNPAPFPSMVVYLGRDLEGFIEIFGSIGDVFTRSQ